MKVVLTMVVRDEEDILGAHLSFHLNAGVDYVLVTDHRSVDGTPDILEQYVKDGVLRVFREEEEHTRQGQWMTRMAQAAATEHDATWVLNSDADEFWWPRGGTIRDVLAAIPEPYGVVHAVSRYFMPRPDGDAPFQERMDVRLRTAAPINDPATPFRPVSKVAHRANPSAVVQDGNHTVSNVPFASLRGWRPLEILHFPLRTAVQCARKYEKTWLAWELNLRGDLARARALAGEARLISFYERVAVDDAMLERGLANGSLVVDTRLRDALRSIEHGVPVEFGNPSTFSDAELGRDVSTIGEADLVRLHRSVDELNRRVAAVEGRRAT